MVVRLRNETTVLVRPLEVGDEPLVAALFASLGERSRHERFGAAKPRLSERELKLLADVDHRDHDALVALSPTTGAPIAIARWIRDAGEPETAELALAVADAWQSRGLGGALAAMVAERARERGIARLRASILATNARARALVRRLGRLVSHAFDGATVELVVEL
jgi:acetyltransferase